MAELAEIPIVDGFLIEPTSKSGLVPAKLTSACAELMGVTKNHLFSLGLAGRCRKAGPKVSVSASQTHKFGNQDTAMVKQKVNQQTQPLLVGPTLIVDERFGCFRLRRVGVGPICTVVI